MNAGLGKLCSHQKFHRIEQLILVVSGHSEGRITAFDVHVLYVFECVTIVSNV